MGCYLADGTQQNIKLHLLAKTHFIKEFCNDFNGKRLIAHNGISNENQLKLYCFSFSKDE